MGLAVVLDQPLQHDGAGGHVDAQRQGLGGEHAAHQAGDEQLLDGLLERRQQPGVVRGDAAFQRLAPLPVPEHPQVGLRQVTGVLLDDPADLVDLLGHGQAHPGPHALPDAASQPAREKTNVIAGRSPSRSSRSITCTRDGGRNPPRDGPPPARPPADDGRGVGLPARVRPRCGPPRPRGPRSPARSAAREVVKSRRAISRV